MSDKISNLLTDESLKSPSVIYTKYLNHLESVSCSIPEIIHDKPVINVYENSVFDANECQPTLKYGKLISFINCRALVIDSIFHGVYYHWLYDVLPKILWAKNNDINFNLIAIPSPKFNFQIEILRSVVGDTPIIYAKDSYFFFSNAYTISKMTTGTTPLPWTLSEIQTSFSSNINPHDHKNIYISRGRTNARRVLNESDLTKLLNKYKFKLIYLEDFSFLEQVSLFSQAENIISPHGSGLSNLIFCKNRPNVIELLGPRCGETCFVRLSDHIAASYVALDCSTNVHSTLINAFTANLSDSFNLWDFHVDAERLEFIIRSICH